MKFILMILVLSFSVIGQKITDELMNKAILNQTEENLIWVYFTDKGSATEKYYSNPSSILSPKAIERRGLRSEKGSAIDFTDIPVNLEYINSVKNTGFKLKHKTKWFNGISGYATLSVINEIASLPFVKEIKLVTKLKKDYEIEENLPEKPIKNLIKPNGTNEFDYGDSYTQLQQMNVPMVHDLGITGAGITICVMDAGFNRLSHQVFDQMNIIAAYDFVNGDPNVGDEGDMGEGSHGTQTLSTIGGFFNGQLIGPAFSADYILAKTENTDSETPIEEDNWVAALEWADSIGVDVTSTSLGYIGFDSPYVGYTWEDMDGNTATITKAADLAVGKGIVVVNSAGNEGFNATHNTLGAPADGDSVIAVGAVGASGTRVSFSSVGPTADGRIKPDIMAMGSGVVVASTWSDNGYTTASGTSFSCPLAAGVAALVLSFNPELTPIQVGDILRAQANNSDNPNNEYGWGIIDAYASILNAASPDNTPPDAVNDLVASSITSNSITLQWSVPFDSTAGGVTDFDLRFSESPINNLQDFLNADAINLPFTPGEFGFVHSFTLNNLEFNKSLYFSIRSSDFWENWSELSNSLNPTTLDIPELETSVDEISVNLQPGSLHTETFSISNVSNNPSTLEFLITPQNNTFPENTKIQFGNAIIGNSSEISNNSKQKPVKPKGYSIDGMGGPDNFGYEWIDSDEQNGPVYVWNDISSTGTAATNWIPSSSFDPLDEGYSGPYPIGFDLKFYGNVKTEIYFHSNGYVTFSPISEGTYTNQEIPNSSVPNEIISPLWNDLDGTGGTVYYKQFADKFVIQYDNWGEYFGSGKFTFQIVLSSSGKITYYYNILTGDLEDCTVGIENLNGNDGLNISYNAPYLKNNFAVQISSEPDWMNLSTLAGLIFNENSINIDINLITEDLPEGTYSMDLYITSNDPNTPEKVIPVIMELGQSGLLSSEIQVTSGWNIVSVPLLLEEMSASSIFPTASSSAFGFSQSGYSQIAELENGNGYWLKFSSNQNVNVTGTVYLSDEVPVQEGWNLIGPFNEIVSVSNINSIPADIIDSDFFGYNGSYQIVTELNPGKGYWIKANQVGSLLLNGISKTYSKKPVTYSGTLMFEDASGKRATLYYSDENLNNAFMPPLPPADAFDVRFSSDKYAESFDKSNTIKYQGISYPLHVNYNGEKDLMITYNGNQTILKSGDEIKIEFGESFNIQSFGVIKDFSLEQNYPNPFNPSTQIKFALPENSTVKIDIYNAVGEKINSLVDKTFEKGIHSVEFNGTYLSSGVYFYKLAAVAESGEVFTEIRKMMLLK